MENDEDIKLLENIYDEYEINNIKMIQFHIDTHPIFSNLVPKLSIYNTAVLQVWLFDDNIKWLK